ncbi:hypothetical protein BGZ63DRAFT_231138 [Mariannaea sp. PMI_226]|nr:hypothetical protein BGZ63DRAFT_231138 [Mariannaea sp. PMI_226]
MRKKKDERRRQRNHQTREVTMLRSRRCDGLVPNMLVPTPLLFESIVGGFERPVNAGPDFRSRRGGKGGPRVESKRQNSKKGPKEQDQDQDAGKKKKKTTETLVEVGAEVDCRRRVGSPCDVGEGGLWPLGEGRLLCEIRWCLPLEKTKAAGLFWGGRVG